jgi:hypothetical protein
MHAQAGEKLKKQHITVAERRKFRQQRTKGSSKCWQEKKPHPACQRAFARPIMQGAAAFKIS